MRRAAILCAVLFVAVPAVAPAIAPAAAQDWAPPTVDYSVSVTLADARGQTVSHRLYHTPKRQRLDYKAGANDEVTIVDGETAAVFVLHPALKRYRKAPFVQPEFDFGIGRAATRREKLGEEPIDGLPAVKYRVDAKTADGQEYKGLAWLTAEHRILVKLDGEVKQGRYTRKLTMTTSGLRVGALDPSLFKVPEDYTRIVDKR